MPNVPNTLPPLSPCTRRWQNVSFEFQMFLVGGKVERFLHGFEEKLFCQLHRQIVCWIDEWYGLAMEDGTLKARACVYV